jgi:transcriptional regulator with XRE-family HTH domain
MRKAKNSRLRGADSPLGRLRVAAGLTQEEAMERIAAGSGGRVRNRRPTIVKVEREGTSDLDMLRGMASTYGVPLARVMSANDELRGRVAA